MLRCLSMTLLVSLLLAGAAHAADFVPVEDECNGRKVLVQGVIEPGDYRRFVDFMARHVAGGDLPAVQDPDVLWTVELDSPGGDRGEAMQMGRFLRGAFATTEVAYRYAQRPDGVWDFARSGELVCLDGEDRLSGCHPDIVVAECTGACLLVWLGGATRHANAGRLGQHGLGGDADVASYLGDMGVPGDWRARLLAAVAGDDGWLSWPDRHALAGQADELRELIADCPPPLTRDESYQSVTAPSERLRDALMDRAEAHRSCRRARLADARAALVTRLASRAAADAAGAAGGG